MIVIHSAFCEIIIIHFTLHGKYALQALTFMLSIIILMCEIV